MEKGIDWRSLPQYMQSIRPEYVQMELDYVKSDEVRRTAPKIDRGRGAVVWVYETKAGGGRGAVVAAYFCPAVHPISGRTLDSRGPEMEQRSGLELAELWLYKGARRLLYFWEIGEIAELPKPQPVSAFGLKCPPQSWCKCKAPAEDAL